jgi:hypothetical protein
LQVERLVAAAAQPVSLLHRARYVRLQHLEQQLEMVEGTLELWQQQQHQQPSAQQQREAAQSLQAVAAVQQAAALAAVTEAAAAEQLMADNQQQHHQQQHDCGWQQSAGLSQAQVAPCDPVAATASSATDALQRESMCSNLPSASSGSSSNDSASNASGDCILEARAFMQEQHQQQQQHHHHQQHQQSDVVKEPDSWRRQVWRQHFASSAAKPTTAVAVADPSGLLSALAPEAPPADTFRRLRHVLETYTDVTRYPR